MPPRCLVRPSLKAFTGPSSIQSPFAALSLNPSKTSFRAASYQTKEKRRHDPFLMAQSRRRKAANVSRQQALAADREGSEGSPIESKSTPFIEELKAAPSEGPNSKLNYFLDSEGLQNALKFSKNLAAPLESSDRNTADPQFQREATEKQLQSHANAQEAINRIVRVSNGNNKDQMRIRTQKCIETFGRHNTDDVLTSKPTATPEKSAAIQAAKAPRVGADTGSPEVQVAILTSKIINMSRHLSMHGSNRDRHNKRNMRLLVHRRQKMLAYLRRKERGGPRWQNLVESLGLSDAAWKGEITV